MAAVQKRGGVEIDGLAAAINALGRIQPQLKAEAVDAMRDAAKTIQSGAQSKIGNHGGYSMPTNRGMIGRSATSTGAGVKLRRGKYPWAGGGEYGAVYARVHGPWRFEGRFKRSLYAPYKPPSSSDMFKNKGGYWIQPTIRKQGPAVINDAQKKLARLFVRYLKPEKVSLR